MDIGYHFDLTTLVMREAGFSHESINLALFANGVTDLLGNIPEKLTIPGPGDGPLHTFDFTDAIALKNSKRLHCDNLFVTDDVTRYWKQYLGNLTRILAKAKQTHDANAADPDAQQLELVRALYAIGSAFHTLQDICSHSNWCELHPPLSAGDVYGPPGVGTPRIKIYNGGTIFNAAGEVNLSPPAADPPPEGSPVLYTGIFGTYYESNLKHGDTVGPPPPDALKPWVKEWREYDSATMKTHPLHGHGPGSNVLVGPPDPGWQYQNLDHQDRQVKKHPTDRETYWDEAYVTAYVSSRHIMRQILEWIGPGGFADKLKDVHLDRDNRLELDRLRGVMQSLFLQIHFEDEDGHWKGPGSGDLLSMLATVVGNLSVVVRATANGALAEVFGTDNEPTPQLVKTFLELLHDDSLPLLLYDSIKMSKTEGDDTKPAVVTVAAPAVDAYVITLTFSSAMIPPRQVIRQNDGVSETVTYFSDIDGGCAPELFVEVEAYDIEDAAAVPKKDAIPTLKYRERTICRVDSNEKLEFAVNVGKFFGEPWQVLHIVPATNKAVFFRVRLFDDDSIGFDNDELRINPVPGDERDHLEFAVTDLGPAARLKEDEVTKRLVPVAGDYSLVKNGTPVLFQATGSADTSWFFVCPPANVTFWMTVARVTSA